MYKVLGDSSKRTLQFVRCERSTSRWWISSAPFVKTCEWALEKPH
uniref:Uncharacterized protein n=1 Tax=Anguilla anguilla TaxID=7936 RepID=A0A0E9S1B5_ANGAN